MQTIKKQIASGQLKPVYLLYGTEDYLKKLYRDKLKAAVLKDGNTMNYSRFTGKKPDLNQIREAVFTMPFFAERRFVLIEDCGLFKEAGELADLIKELPGTVCVVFTEQEVDKRNRLYKAVKEKGYISEMNGLSEKDLKLWIATVLSKDGRKITAKTAEELISRAGADMEGLMREMEKLTAYTLGRNVITEEDIEAVCSTQISGKIFQMIDAIAARKQERAMALYQDLLSLRERPMTILYLLTKHFNRLLLLKELQEKRMDSASMAKVLSVPPFAVSKYREQAGNFSQKKLRSALETSAEIEESVKKGRLFDQIGVELLIVRYASEE